MGDRIEGRRITWTHDSRPCRSFLDLAFSVTPQYILFFLYSIPLIFPQPHSGYFDASSILQLRQYHRCFATIIICCFCDSPHFFHYSRAMIWEPTEYSCPDKYPSAPAIVHVKRQMFRSGTFLILRLTRYAPPSVRWCIDQ